MALNYNKNKIFGFPLTSGSVTQLNKRREIVSKRTERTPDDIYYLSSNTAWVRVTSAVDVENDGGPKNSKKYQLFKGISSADKGFVPVEDPERSSYIESEEYGYVPIAGITNFEVQTKNQLGTLRVAKVTFIVNSPEDFSKLEQLYLRPGFLLLLEWGHSVKVNNDGTIDSSVKYYDLDTFSTEQKIKDIKDGIVKLREENSYNYDGMLGLVRNFSWGYNGYNYLCTVDVVSHGEVLESLLNTNAPTSKTDQLDESVEYNSRTFGSDIDKILNIIRTAPIEDLFNYSSSTNIISQATEKIKSLLTAGVGKDYSDAINSLNIIAGKLAGDGIKRDSLYTRYIRLRDFLGFLNASNLLYDKDRENIIQFYVGDEVYPFITFDSHIGLDPGICVLPKKGRHKDYFIPFAEQAQNLEETDILNIFLSVDYLSSMFAAYSKSEVPTDNNVFNLVDSILKGIENNLGGVNEFYVAYDEDTDIFYIVDTKVTPSNQDYEIGEDGNPKAYLDLVGLKSEVTNIQVQSNLASNFSALISVAAQNSSDPAALENISSLHRWNEGLKNRHLPEVYAGRTSADREKELKEIEDQRKKYSEFLKTCASSNPYYLIYDQNKFQGYSNIHKHITRKQLQERTNQSQTNPPGLIPLTLSFSIKGISGLKVMQSFKINEFFLPEKYKGRVSFIIRGLDHKVENGKWITDISAYINAL